MKKRIIDIAARSAKRNLTTKTRHLGNSALGEILQSETVLMYPKSRDLVMAMKKLRNEKLLRHKEALIHNSGLFCDEYYRAQLDSTTSINKNLVRHYLLEGNNSGISPNPLFDKEWYAQEYPDLQASVKDFFFHYVEYGEKEHRSPHPLFEPFYYLAQTDQLIERPLKHFTAGNGRTGLDPHPLFKVSAFLEYCGDDLPGDANPLVHFLNNPACEAFIRDRFNGHYYADALGEPYNWPRHGIAEFLKRTVKENIVPHAGVDTNTYAIFTNQPRSLRSTESFNAFFSTKSKPDEVRSDPVIVRAKKLESGWTGEYKTEFSKAVEKNYDYCALVNATAVRLPSKTIEQCREQTHKDVNGRLRLDRPLGPPSTENGHPVISILMPVYKPPLIYLDRAIRSVTNQSYGNWELCIVDDFSEDDAVSGLLKYYVSLDSRIRVSSAEKNGGISRASNAALSLSTGEYIALLDNDDMITFDAIKEITHAISNNPDVEFIYSDECLIDENDLTVKLFSKPDWSPTLLYACMYTGHFTTYRKSLIEKLGGFRPEFDFSQDYDLALRVSGTSPNVHHIQAYLYGWRMIAGSAAQGGKPYARQTNVAALQDALDQRQYPGEGLGYPSSNVIVRCKHADQPMVSIIIPSDNSSNILDTLKSIKDHTSYTNYEVIIVTNSKIKSLLQSNGADSKVKLVAYDSVFNFSDKCNKGANASLGEFLVFFNDDVRVISGNWIESLLDLAVLDYIGAVAPKLLYEDGSIQHAGMVTGVRRLVGTAFHTYPSETSEHFGMAQYAREVSLLCGACIMVRASVYNNIGGFDSKNTPINHSDVDLCLRIRESGLACVYVPTTSLKHIGHVSIGELEKQSTTAELKRDKADIFLLKRWSEAVAYDPYFPPPMRDIIFRDSHENFWLYPGVRRGKNTTVSDGQDILLVSHDLTNSGAPKIVHDLAVILRDAGNYVCVLSPSDGPMRERLTEQGIDVIVDELALLQHPSVYDFAKNFDKIIINTIVSWPILKQLRSVVPIYWYIHESELIDHFVNIHADFLACFQFAEAVWVGSGKSGRHLANHGIENFQVIPYGVSDVLAASSDHREPEFKNDKIVIGVFGSFEPRKGQDLAILGLMGLSDSERDRFELRLFGRTLDRVFANALLDLAAGTHSIKFGGELSPESYINELSKVDIVLVPSRDDTLPLVSLDALAGSKILIVSSTTGTSEWLEDRESAMILRHNSPIEISEALREIGLNTDRSKIICAGGRKVYEQDFSWESFVMRIRNLLKMSLVR